MTEFGVTFFLDKQARKKAQETLTLEALAERIRSTQSELKDTLPLLKLSEFGMVESAHGSLRHNDNVRCVTGCEGDYDGETLAFDWAVERLTKAGVLALVYTSPSHEPDRPRWRVICPFSDRLPPAAREHMMRRLNGLLDGALGDESFTLSQSYYYGHLIECPEYRVEIVPGNPIDTCDDLDRGARGKSGTVRGNGGNGGDTEYVDKDDLIAAIMSGESLHNPAMRLIGRLAHDGLSRTATTEIMHTIFRGAQAERYAGRWPEMLREIDYVYLKEARANGDAQNALNAQNAETYARGPQQTPHTPHTPQKLTVIKPGEWIDHPPPAPEYTVAGIMPRRQVFLLSGHGAAGKSTLGLQCAAAHAAGGRPWLVYDPIPGPAFFLDCEDEEGIIHARLAAIAEHYGLTLNDFDANLYILPLVGQDTAFAEFARNGAMTPSPLYRQLEQMAGDLKPVQIVISSAADVYPGEENDRMRVTKFVRLLTRLARLANATVTLISHPSLTGITNRSGISGSTAWHNAVRAQGYLQGVEDDGVAVSDLRKLEFKKNQYGRVAETLTLEWRDGLFLPRRGTSDYDRAATEANAERVFLAALTRFLASGRNLSHKATAHSNYAPKVFAQEDDAKAHRLTKKDLEGAMRRLFDAGKIMVKSYGSPSRGWERLEVK